jgi:ribosomal protein S18 acetylase RimI-like enzyme
MKVEIRPFRLADHPAAVRLWQATEGIGLSDADSLQGITLFLECNPDLSFVGVSGGELVATILCGHDGRRGFIYHLAVEPGHRHRGLGRELVERCLTALRAAGIDKCHLHVFRENVAGLAFWRRIGAEERTSLVTLSFLTPERHS